MRYYIVVDGLKTTEFTRGIISGMIYVLSGMPDISYGYARRATEDTIRYITAFDGDDEMHKTIVEAINKRYPDAILVTKTTLE